MIYGYSIIIYKGIYPYISKITCKQNDSSTKQIKMSHVLHKEFQYCANWFFISARKWRFQSLSSYKFSYHTDCNFRWFSAHVQLPEQLQSSTINCLQINTLQWPTAITA